MLARLVSWMSVPIVALGFGALGAFAVRSAVVRWQESPLAGVEWAATERTQFSFARMEVGDVVTFEVHDVGCFHDIALTYVLRKLQRGAELEVRPAHAHKLTMDDSRLRYLPFVSEARLAALDSVLAYYRKDHSGAWCTSSKQLNIDAHVDETELHERYVDSSCNWGEEKGPTSFWRVVEENPGTRNRVTDGYRVAEVTQWQSPISKPRAKSR